VCLKLFYMAGQVIDSFHALEFISTFILYLHIHEPIRFFVKQTVTAVVQYPIS